MHECEKIFVQFLDRQNKTWLYEPKRFILKTSTYKPDFYCPEDDTYYEVVGTRQAISAIFHKIIEFKNTYPNIKFKIVNPNGEPYKGSKLNLPDTYSKLKDFYYLPQRQKYSKGILSKIPIVSYYKMKELSEKESRTVASVIRQAVKEFFERREKSL